MTDQFPSQPPDERLPEPPASDTPRTVVFEDLTLAQVLAYLIFRPGQTSRLLWQVLTHDAARQTDDFAADSAREIIDAGAGADSGVSYPREIASAVTVEALAGRDYVLADRARQAAHRDVARQRVEQRAVWLRIVVLAAAVLLALRGGAVLHASALNPVLKLQRNPQSAPLWFVLAGSLYAGFELWSSRLWWARRLPRLHAAVRERFTRNDLQHIWIASLVALIAFVLLLVLAGAGGVIGGALLVIGAAALWIVLLLGSTPLAFSPAEDVSPEQAAPQSGAYVVRSVVRAAPAADEQTVSTVPAQGGFGAWFQAHAGRLLLVPVALLCSSLAYSLNVARDVTGTPNDVVITLDGGIAWLLSIVLWALVLGVDPAHVAARVRRAASIRPGRAWLRKIGWPGLALLIVIGIGAIFRLHDLSSTPPEMTSDHIEKLLDALRVHDGYRGVFFPNNGGREGFQMYFAALIAGPFGAGFNFDALKLATVIEGLVTLPALWWMARQVIGTDTAARRRLGTWVGVALAGLVAVSSWHVMLSRLGLRIVLTPLTVALVIGFLARAMRHNRVGDYAALGFVLGAGMYFYQANRMLPLVVVIGAGLLLLGRVRKPGDVLRLVGEGAGFTALVLFPLLVVWYFGQVMEQSGSSATQDTGERLTAFIPIVGMAWFSLLALYVRARRSEYTLQVGGGLLAAAVIALAVYVPMYHYSVIRPDEFWNRTRGRMFGEEAFWRTDPVTGNTVVVEPTTGDQVRLFWQHRDVFVDNYADALRMFQWEGDRAWINDASAYPALDAVSGGLLVLGLAVWGVWAARRRDPVIWLLPVTGLIMLLPSAMTLAYTIENPSFTRASGAIPPVYMLAALPVGLLCANVARLRQVVWRVPVGAVAAVILVNGVAVYAMGPDWQNFFTDYRLSYSNSWKPYSAIARPMRAFAQGEGSYGNAFMVAYPHWLDHRILGTMAGDIRWPNGLVTRDELVPMIERNQGTAYQYDPTKPLFVMYDPEDMETAAYLAALFPGGETRLYEYNYPTPEGEGHGSFFIYEVLAGPILG